MFAFVEELGKATPLKVFRAGGSPLPPVNCAITKPSTETPDTVIGDATMVQPDTTMEERPNEPQRMNIDPDLLKAPLKEISNCPFEDDGKVGPSVVSVCDSISIAPLKRIDPSLQPTKKSLAEEGSS